MTELTIKVTKKEVEQAVPLPQGELMKGIAGSLFILQINKTQYLINVADIIDAISVKELATFEQQPEPVEAAK